MITTEELANNLHSYELAYGEYPDSRCATLCNGLNYATNDRRQLSDAQHWMCRWAAESWRSRLEVHYAGKYSVTESGRYVPVV